MKALLAAFLFLLTTAFGLTRTIYPPHWVTSDKRLYRARDGNWVPVFKDDETDPFQTGRIIFNAWQDAAGDVFFNSAGANGKFIQIAPQYPPPNPRIRVSVLNEDRGRLTLEGEEVYRWRWRFDASCKQGLRTNDGLRFLRFPTPRNR